MTQLYLSKSITSSSTGITATAWWISDWRIQNNIDPTKITISIGLSCYVSPSTLSGGLNSVPGVRYNYRLTATNFPEGTDLTTVTLTQIYNATLDYLTKNTSEPLSGAVIASL